ncbi:2-oxoacid:acceptor oxidoreductase subunit alpha [bacterium]|nr:2-oxoacid:acceptor oxidoreductase subunit alpha [bacterium]
MLFYKLYKDADGRKVGFVQGNEACVEAALLAGMRFFAGYPITPSSEIAAVSAEKLPMLGGRFIQMEDEISSMGAIIGGSMTGKKTMTATSGPGFSLKQENLGYAIINEVPCVIVNVQRGGPSTGLPTQIAQADVMQARWGTHGDHPIIAISPASVSQVVTSTIRAFNLAEKYRTPVILLMDETLGHMREKIVLPREDEIELIDRKQTEDTPEEFKPFATKHGDVPLFAPYGKGYRYNITGLIHDEAGFPTTKTDEVVSLLDRLHSKINDNLDDIVEVCEFQTEDADTLLVSFGSATRSCISAMEKGRAEGKKIGVLQLLTVWPFAEKQIVKLTEKIKNVFVVEMNMGQIIGEVSRCSHRDAVVTGINKYNGIYITPQEILEKVKESR